MSVKNPVSSQSFVSTNGRSNKNVLCITMCNNDNTNQITDISALQFIRTLCNFIHSVNMQLVILVYPVPGGIQKFESSTSLVAFD